MSPTVLLGAMIVGATLGLLGSGGAIFAVPILVYLLGHAPKAAIAESLAIVGGIALICSIGGLRQRLVEWRAVAFFGVPAMVGTSLGSTLGTLVPARVQLGTLAVVMVVASVAMLRRSARGAVPSPAAPPPSDDRRPRRFALLAVQGVAVGVLTGFVGVGGGFLIVPALVLLVRLPMARAVATSLAIIALASTTGFLGYLRTLSGEIDPPTIAWFLAIGGLGGLVGGVVGRRLDQRLLQRIFAVGLLVVAAGMIWAELARG
jgi:uncharacterized membrane protein YfcA